MEGNKQKGTSSSFTSELFGSTKESHHPSSSAGIFGSIFSPASSKTKVFGREALRSESNCKIANGTRSSKNGSQDHFSKENGSEAQNTVNKDKSSIYQDQILQPCHLSSSIYYGGQDICPSPQSTHSDGLNSLYKNDAGEDDSELASRGNWWQGSLYY